MTDDPKLKVRQFIIRQFPLARKKQVRDSDALLETGMVDSMGVLQLVSFIEREFSITISDDDLVPDNFQTIDQITALIADRIGSSEDPHGDIRASR